LARQSRASPARPQTITLLLTDRKSGHTMLVVTTAVKKGWQFGRLRDWGVGLRDEVFVQVAPPGRYVRDPDAESKPREFTSTLLGVLTGAIAQTSERLQGRCSRHQHCVES
jgi:hypothetical protein